MNFPPAIIGMASQQTQTPQTQANITITLAQEGSNTQTRNDDGGSLMGNAPPIFYGNRARAQEFLDTITIWKAVNYKKDVIKDPYTRTALVLTYIKGDNVNSWAKRAHQLPPWQTEQTVISGKHHLSFHTFSHLIAVIRPDKTENAVIKYLILSHLSKKLLRCEKVRKLK